MLSIGIVSQQGAYERYQSEAKLLNTCKDQNLLKLFEISIGANLLPKRLPSRIALFQIIIHSWIMYNYYSASIVSARLSEPLDMMEDSVTVLADSNLKIAAEAVPYLNYFLYVSLITTFK